jgi:hypothetical protein
MYLVESLGNSRNHHALYIEIDKTTEAGQLLNVVGNIQVGMEFESEATTTLPESSHSFVSKTFLGWVSRSDVSKVEDACKSNPPPAKQFNGPKRIDPKRPLRRCQEWTAETIELLEKKGLLRREGQRGSERPTS